MTDIEIADLVFAFPSIYAKRDKRLQFNSSPESKTSLFIHNELGRIVTMRYFFYKLSAQNSRGRIMLRWFSRLC